MTEPVVVYVGEGVKLSVLNATGSVFRVTASGIEGSGEIDILLEITPATDQVIDDRKIGDTVNALRDIAVEYRNAQQLRERIAHVIVPLLKRQAECKQCDAKQAKIDALMLESCPDEMTKEQMATWADHQRAVPEHKQGCDALGGYGHGVGVCSCGAAQPTQDSLTDQTTLAELRLAFEEFVTAVPDEVEPPRNFIRRNVDGTYFYKWTESNWQAWQACALWRVNRQAAPEQPADMSEEIERLQLSLMVAALHASILRNALENIANYRTDVDSNIAARSMRFYAETALKDSAVHTIAKEPQ